MLLFVAASILYLIVIQQDFSRRTIPNILPILVFTLAVARWSIAGAWTELFDAAIAASISLVILFAMFLRGWIGGGDVKLIAATLVLTGISEALPFLVYMSVFGGLMVPVAVLQSRFGPRKAEPLSVPYGIAIAAAALWVLFPGDASSILGSAL